MPRASLRRSGTSESGDNDTGHIVRDWTVSRGPNATLKITLRPSEGESDLIDAIVTAFKLPEDAGDYHYLEQTVYGWMSDG
ncbi:hypothetical protein L486_07274 [Kwoniella mangroviensis CBS 10435]|uniref:Uncharacterized protein n=1 Tax=Kwoniella mangroviensis CBS 10435 TaxID=1331196 RepID=A0A1B9IHZ4_9TREE|nr:uncharacterized protein I203_04834 [Kwoniella mangroviensis CBS 8507]OCF55162.1 hypothetical protein L486_07274 [Kwoniella mangroviensis CBS 10435]OCF65815.1 hypothetical protein I203_04834 [Kwoniella mangroviensis CBS 8507]